MDTNEKWVKDTENCTLSEYRLYIFLQSCLYIIHTKLFIYFFTFLIMSTSAFLGYYFLKYPFVKVYIFGIFVHLLVYIFINKDPELNKNKDEVYTELIRLKKLKKRKIEKLKNDKK